MLPANSEKLRNNKIGTYFINHFHGGLNKANKQRLTAGPDGSQLDGGAVSTKDFRVNQQLV